MSDDGVEPRRGQEPHAPQIAVLGLLAELGAGRYGRKQDGYGKKLH